MNNWGTKDDDYEFNYQQNKVDEVDLTHEGDFENDKKTKKRKRETSKRKKSTKSSKNQEEDLELTGYNDFSYLKLVDGHEKRPLWV